MSERFVKDPHQVLKTGDIVRVKVMNVDIPRKRIGLSMRMTDEADGTREKQTKSASPQSGKNSRSRTDHHSATAQARHSAMADAFANAGRRSGR